MIDSQDKVFPTQYSWSGPPSSIRCSRWPQTVTTLSGWIWLLLFISCHFPSDQIQGVGCLPSPRVTPLWPDITSPKTASLTLPVKTSSNCCHSGPALSHHSGLNEEEERERHKRRCMRDMYKGLSNSVVMSAQYISLLTFQHVWQREGYLWANAEFIDFSRLCQLLTINKAFICTSRGSLPSAIPSFCQ